MDTDTLKQRIMDLWNAEDSSIRPPEWHGWTAQEVTFYQDAYFHQCLIEVGQPQYSRNATVTLEMADLESYLPADEPAPPKSMKKRSK